MKNPFVSERSNAMGIPQPDIEVTLREQYGQMAEDIIVEGLLMAWAQRTGSDLSTCRYLEIGANHPIATSASYLLYRLHGMTGVLVEANADLLDGLKSVRPADEVAYCAITSQDVSEADFYICNLSELSSMSRGFVEHWPSDDVGVADVRRVPAMRVNTLLEKHFVDSALVFLSVDCEGLDLDILRDVDWVRWRPVVIQVEPSDHFITGQSTAIVNFMHEKGYVLVARTKINMIFSDRATLLGGVPLAQGESSLSIPVPTAPFIAPRPSYSEAVSVGIVTRTKNRTVLLRRALESVKQQSYPHWQLVVVNDGGEPGPVDELVQAVFEGDGRVSVVHHPQSVGMEAASNSGLSRLTTELAIIHDDDDSWAPEMLAVATAVLRQRNATMPSIRGLVTRVNWVQETVTANHIEIRQVRPWNDHSSDRLSEGLISLERLAKQNLYPPIAFVFDLSLARRLGGFDQNLPVLGDWDFHLKFCQRADIWVHPELLAFYHHRADVTGDMANTVVAAKAKHELYDAFLRNKLLRSHDNSNQTAMVLLQELRAVNEKMGHINFPTSHSLSKKMSRKKKSRLGTFLSEINRKRKRLMSK